MARCIEPLDERGCASATHGCLQGAEAMTTNAALCSMNACTHDG
eukprot:CAMPEP_0183390952 /NCGR_PEP_ID=MMETSP0370-20130417/6115_1 /TAXON_ID=268820 /ORGANISM="Peridinium aciculiferum, Strain PAER-2" /LENGTH=43 /DNA_ID= /DNA_START= /DNA_END= /DNA_ORIENTATION=